LRIPHHNSDNLDGTIGLLQVINVIPISTYGI
jgi:hypothetical protein